MYSYRQGPRSIHAVPYRPSPKLWEAEEKEIDKMSTINVIEGTQKERKLPIVLVPKKADPYDSVQIISNQMQ